ncbi:MAG: site-2 protease family protein [Cytophagales bacterium]|nr:MAG: site-2 protease family protein [Cytophagales bacterium]TAF61521.1 MAG: site-2 protease family protein [Cytophagales bacterium]
MSYTPRQYLLHGTLFLLTLLTTTWAGAEWLKGSPLFHLLWTGNYAEFWQNYSVGFRFSLPLLGFLSLHEFGHFYYAQKHKLAVSMPFFIPIWLGFLGGPISIGTAGAFISIKSAFRTRREVFDVGVAGPILGFIVALGILFWGFTHLPPPEFIFEIHPDYKAYGLDYAKYVYNDAANSGNIELGSNLLFEFFKHFVANDPAAVPNGFELIHYPWLFAGYLALVFTALNMLPMGQLDGGHVIYALFGYEQHRSISRICFAAFVFYAGLGMVEPYNNFWDEATSNVLYLLYLFLVFYTMFKDKGHVAILAICIFVGQFAMRLIWPSLTGYSGWLVLALLIGRVLGLYHPPAYHETPLSTTQKVIAWISLLIFALCFSPEPIKV